MVFRSTNTTLKYVVLLPHIIIAFCLFYYKKLKKMSRTFIHKCDLTLAKDNIAYMIVILATHSRLSLFGCWTMDQLGELDTESDPAFETKNPNILAKPYYCKIRRR